jgi:hypothetical protein
VTSRRRAVRRGLVARNGKDVAVAVTELTEPEQALWQAFPRGAWVDLGAGDLAADDPGRAPDWPESRVIRAEVISALLLGAADTEPGHAPGVRIRGARITGRLDLMGATVTCPLICEHCSFDEEIRFVESVTRTVRIVHSRLPAFNGTRMRLDGILNLWACQITGVLRLDQAKVTGQLCLRDAVIGGSGGTEAVAAFGLAVEGGVECTALTAHGSLGLRVAVITGGLDLRGARISCPGQPALLVDRTVIGGRLDGPGLTVEGETRMYNTRVGASLVLAAASLANPGGVALSAGGLIVTGGVFLTGGFSAAGEVLLIGARLAANLSLAGAALDNPGGTALNLDRATVGTCDAPGATCTGQVSFTGARISGDLNLRDAQLIANPGDPALVAEHASVDGGLILSGLRADGEIRVRTAGVGQRILLMGAQLSNPGGIALRLSRSQVGADVFCDEMTASGGIRVAGATIGGELSFRQARISHPAGPALDASGLRAAELSLRTAEPMQGLIDLRHAQIGVLRDDPDCWPGQLSMDGLTYQALEPRLPARQRLDWLNRDPEGQQTQPYEQLAAHYTAIGQPGQARAVRYAGERARRQAMPPLARTWSLLQDITVGYGYQPRRAVAWLAALLAAGSVTFALAPPPPLIAGQAPHFNPVVYTLDLLLPVVDLGQKHAFNPAGAEQWFSYILVAAGWVLVSTVAAGAARVLTRR